jgi:hypothetical protein
VPVLACRAMRQHETMEAVSDELELAERSSALERSWRHLPLTPEEHQARRRNRRWLLVVFCSSVGLLIAALVASGIAQSNEPTGPKISVPAGYKAVNDGYFSYAVPASWSTNPTYTDSAGDMDTAGPTGWAGEHISYRTTAPAAGEAPPAVLDAFGVPRPEPIHLADAAPIDVRGAEAAYSYQVTRPGGFRATAVDAWDSRHGVELWLLVDASPAITASILGSLT